MDTVLYYIFLGIILIISIGLHEFAHARTSNKLGDPTPKLQGRLTPNPLKHIDPVWFLMIFLIHFGRGKPVVVNPYYYKHPLRDELIVALAGPAMNLLLAFAGMIMIFFYASLIGLDQAPLDAAFMNDIVLLFRYMFCSINIALAAFNLLPVPPLDGFRIVAFLYPQISQRVQRNYQMVSIAFLLIIVWPWSQIIGTYITTVSDYIFYIFYGLLSHIFY